MRPPAIVRVSRVLAIVRGMSVVALAACGGAASRPPAPPTAGPTTHTVEHDAPPEEGRAGSDEPVARTAHFVFYSRFVFNLHDRLRRWALDHEREDAACERAEAGDWEAWQRAVQAFAAFAPDGARGAELRARYWLLDPSLEVGPSLGELPSWYPQALRDASPAYQRCWWAGDDRRNRAWITALLPRLARAEPEMIRRITSAHRTGWPTERIPVDVVQVVNFGGANTVVDPNHTLISCTAPGYDGFGGIETLFHEASHTIVSPRSGGSVEALATAAARHHVTLPRDLWHVILFLTAGEAARATIADLWHVEYAPYMYTQGLFARAWPTLQAPVERWWLPYLRGASSFDDAIEGLVQAVGTPEETTAAPTGSGARGARGAGGSRRSGARE